MRGSQSNLHFVHGSPRIAYEAAGDGEVVVFLHGIGGNRSNWAEQLERFGRDFRAVAWDARGYGDSDDYDGPFEFADVSSDLCRLLDHLSVARANLVGLSMGGRILMDFAHRYPDRITSLTIAASFPSFGKALSAQQREEFVRLRLTPIQNGRPFSEMAPELADALLGPLASDAARASVCASIGALRADSYSKAVKAAVDFDRTAVLASIHARVLLLCGEHDRLVPPPMMRAMQATIPNAELHVLPGIGHMLNLESPDLFDRHLAEFLARETPGSRRQAGAPIP